MPQMTEMTKAPFILLRDTLSKQLKHPVLSEYLIDLAKPVLTLQHIETAIRSHSAFTVFTLSNTPVFAMPRRRLCCHVRRVHIPPTMTL